MVTATLRTFNAKTEQGLMSSGRPRALDNMHFIVSYQIDIVNKQLLSPLEISLYQK